MQIQNLNNPAQPARLGNNGTPDAVAVAPVRQSVEVAQPQVTDQMPSANQLKSMVDNANKVLRQTGSNNLEFSFDSDTHITVIKLVDTETGEVIRQIPSKEMLAIARSIDQIQQGLLLKQKA